MNGIDEAQQNAQVLNIFFSDIGPNLDPKLGPDPQVVTERASDCPHYN